MVWANLGTAAMLTGLVAAMAAQPARTSESTDEVQDLRAALTQVDATSRLDILEYPTAKLAAAFAIVTRDEGADSVAAREARLGGFFCGFPFVSTQSSPRLPRASYDAEVQIWLDDYEVKRSKPDTATLEELQRLLEELETWGEDSVRRGPAAEHDGGFFCGYPPQLVFGFHVPARIDAGLRWCFDCGAWQPCACPRSVAGPPVPFPGDDDPQTKQTVLDRLWEASRSLGRKLEELNDAMDDIQKRARSQIEATDPDLFLKQRIDRARRSSQFPDPGPMIKSAFGILIPESMNWPTIKRYFAKPLPGSALPHQRPAATQGTP